MWFVLLCVVAVVVWFVLGDVLLCVCMCGSFGECCVGVLRVLVCCVVYYVVCLFCWVVVCWCVVMWFVMLCWVFLCVVVFSWWLWCLLHVCCVVGVL